MENNKIWTVVEEARHIGSLNNNISFFFNYKNLEQK